MGIFTTVGRMFGGGTSSGRNGKDEESVEPGPKPTVLVIDDDAKFLETMRILLGGAGYGVLTSNTGPKGLDMLRYGPRDVGVVLLDFNMPRFNGADTLEYLRKLNGQVKVIAVSGLRTDELPVGFQEGVDRFVAKPFSNGELLETLQDVLGGNPEAEPAASASA
ncbi:MAG TPA: response regulator [Verrucomicrobiae bacterium]|nr:response regulator [Verrucomicrobiae bacterium]